MISKSWKEKVKAVTPDWVLKSYIYLKSDSMRKLFLYDKRRYSKYYSPKKPNSYEQINAKLVFYAHSLEKGLSHIDFRMDFGHAALEGLKECMINYNKHGYPKNGLAYQNALSCLKAYEKKHLDISSELPTFYKHLFHDFNEEIQDAKYELGGFDFVEKKDKVNNRTKNYETLFTERVSIREYADTMIDMNLIYEAIDISMKSPSVCNRQSSRIRIITNSEIMNEVLYIQGGFSGYKKPPVLLLVTTDTEAFVDKTERNQIYIDGGLFSMSILAAIEYVGLAACPLNTMFDTKKEKKIRLLLNIPENENFIMFITIGEFLDITPYPKSFRYSGQSITKTIL